MESQGSYSMWIREVLAGRGRGVVSMGAMRVLMMRKVKGGGPLKVTNAFVPVCNRTSPVVVNSRAWWIMPERTIYFGHKLQAMNARSILLPLLCTLGPVLAHAQITVFATSTARLMQLTSLEDAGPKYIDLFTFGFSLPVVTIYNVDMTVYRELTLPAGTYNYMALVTGDLFDTDPTTIEYAIQVDDGAEVRVYREDGTLLLSKAPGVLPSGPTMFPVIEVGGVAYLQIDASYNGAP